MGKINELHRELVNEVAGHYLSEQDEGDNYDAYQTLLEVEDDTDFAHNHVTVWESLEYITVKSLVEMIQGGVQNLEHLLNNQNVTQVVPEFLNDIDYTELRNQKRTLLELINSLESKEHQRAKDFIAILHLIDKLQEFGVEKLNWRAIDVYDFELEENREEDI